MLRAGKLHWMIPVGIVGVLVVLFFVFSPRETPQGVGAKFMDALARGDAKTLTELSYTDGSVDELQKKWQFSVSVPGKHYWFSWRLKSDRITSDNEALVRLMVDTGKGYEEDFDLPLLKKDGHWKVDAYGLSRALYPGLPRRDF